jgi:hypothetical protein
MSPVVTWSFNDEHEEKTVRQSAAEAVRMRRMRVWCWVGD